MPLHLNSGRSSRKRSLVEIVFHAPAGRSRYGAEQRLVGTMPFHDCVRSVTTGEKEIDLPSEAGTYAHADVGDVHELTRKGIQSTSVSQVIRLALQFGTQIVLTRLIPPADFGVVAMGAVLAGFAAVLAESGTQSAIVQRSDLREVHLSAALVINLAMAGSVALILAAAAPFIADFYRAPGVRTVVLLLAAGIVIPPLSVVHRGLLERSFRFRVLAAIDVVAAVISSGISIGLAVAGFGIAAIVAIPLVTAVVTTALSWLSVHWRPTVLPTRQAIKHLLGFSGHLLSFNLLNYWARNLDNLLVGRFFGPYQAGLYTRSYSLLLLPVSQVSAIFGRVMLPSMSSVQTDLVRAREAYLSSLTTISCLMTPVSLGLALVAGDLVTAVLGPQWIPAIGMIRVFALLGIVQGITITVGWIFLSQGKPNRMLLLSIFNTTIVIASFFVGVVIGSAFAVAVSYAIAGVLVTYPTVRMAYALIDLSIRSAARRLAPSLLASAAMIPTTLLAHQMLTDVTPILRLLLESFTGAATYMVAGYFLKIPLFTIASPLRWVRRGVLALTAFRSR
jgi:O-antigen/teichoic acid export membrane protein